jgi:hypothetical protein
MPKIISPEERATDYVTFRMTAKEKKYLQEKAEKAGVTMGQFLRNLVIAELRKHETQDEQIAA